MDEKIYIVGHKSPDLDSVASAISYSELKNKLEKTEKYIPAIAGGVNKVTEYVLEKFGYQIPEILTSAEDKNLILVDHNELSQMVAGGDKAKILEILDHHKFNFNYGEPIEIQTKPWGSSNSIIFQKYLDNQAEISKELAGLMLSSILDDTVITKSPTCTKKDAEIIDKLSEMSGIKDWKAYGMEMFKVKSSVADLSDEEIIKMDFKDFELKIGKFGIGQVETVDLDEFKNREDNLIKSLENLRTSQNYHSTILFITDIIEEGSLFLVSTTEPAKIEKAFDVKIENNRFYKKDIMSRKKQVAPKLTEVFDK